MTHLQLLQRNGSCLSHPATNTKIVPWFGLMAQLKNFGARPNALSANRGFMYKRSVFNAVTSMEGKMEGKHGVLAEPFASNALTELNFVPTRRAASM